MENTKPKPQHSDVPLNRHRQGIGKTFEEEHGVPQSNSWPDPIQAYPEEGPEPPLPEDTAQEDAQRLKEWGKDPQQMLQKQLHNEEEAYARRDELKHAVPEGGIFAAAVGVYTAYTLVQRIVSYSRLCEQSPGERATQPRDAGAPRPAREAGEQQLQRDEKFHQVHVREESSTSGIISNT